MSLAIDRCQDMTMREFSRFINSLKSRKLNLTVEETRIATLILKRLPQIKAIIIDCETSNQLVKTELNAKIDDLDDSLILCKALVSSIENVILEIRDPHERSICKQLFIEGKKFKEVVRYHEIGYTSELFPISGTATADKRRRAITRIGLSMKAMGLLNERIFRMVGA